MIISGSVALEFFERTEYANSDLDLYVDDRFRRPVAIWLKSIGYKFLPRPAFGPKDLDAALNYELDEDETSPSIVGPMRNRYPKAILVLDFIKSNPHSRIQLITSSATPLEMVLRFHSSERRPSKNKAIKLKLNMLTKLFSLRHEPDHLRQSLLHFPSCNLRGTMLVDLRPRRGPRRYGTREVRTARVVIY